MKEDWKECKLGEIVEMNPTESIKKGTISKKIGMDLLQPFCRSISSFTTEAYSGGAKFRNKDTIMARITPCLENGKTAMVNILDDNEIGFGSTEYIVFRAKNNISDPYFIYYLITSSLIREPAIKSMVGSSGRQRVQTDVVANLSINLPPLATQQKIATILSSLDDKIELNNKINDNLEQQAQAIFKSWFVDFEPFGGKMPEGWRMGKVGEIIELYDSKRIPLSGQQREKMEKRYPYYGATSLMDFVDNYLFDGIYLLLGEDGTVVDTEGYPILQYVEGKFWVNNHAHILTGKNGFSVEMLYLLFSLTNVKDKVTGAVQQKISQGNLISIDTVIPTIDYCKKIDELIQPIFSQIRNNRSENQKLTALRDTLLPKLMSGKIEVNSVQV